MRVSATLLSTFMDCPLKGKFRYVDHLPVKRNSYMTFGIVMHASLEEYAKHGDIDKTIDFFLDLWDNPEKVNAEIEVWPKGTTMGGLMERGLELLRSNHESQQWDPGDIIASEHKFLVPCGKHEIVGVVDRVEIKKSGRGKNTVRVIDFKTAKRQPTKDQLALNVQLTLYLYASLQKEFWLGNGDGFPPISPDAEELWEKVQGLPRRAIWWNLNTAKQIDAGPRIDEDYLRMYRAITEIARALEYEVYVPDISGESCHWCDFTKPCGVEIERDYDEDDAFF